MLIAQNSIKLSDVRKHSEQFLDELNAHDHAVTVYKRSKPVAVIMSPSYYMRLSKKPEVNWGRATQAMEDLFSFADGTPEIKGFDAVEIIRKERGY